MINPAEIPALYLLRHGETDWNRAGRIQGQKNSGLTELGRDQARRQAEILGRLALPADCRAIASPLGRTRETADIALRGRAYDTDARLIEIGCGAWEGLSAAERAARDPGVVQDCRDDLDLYRLAPSGEGLPAVQKRVEGFLADLAEPTIIVAHKVILILIRARLTGVPDHLRGGLESTQGTVIHLAGDNETLHR